MANQLTPAPGPSKAVAVATTGKALAMTTAAEPLTYASAVERWEQGTDLTAYDLYDLEGNKVLRYFKRTAQPPDEAVYEATYAELQAVADYITRDCRGLRGDKCREKAARQFDDHACARLAQLVASDIDSTLVRVEMTRRIAYGAQCPAFLRNATAALVEEKMELHVSGKDPGAPILRYFRGDDFPGMAAWFTMMIRVCAWRRSARATSGKTTTARRSSRPA